MPDLGYFSGPLHLEEFTHTIAGVFAFCLPIGLLLYWLGRCVAVSKPGRSFAGGRLAGAMTGLLPPRAGMVVGGSLLLGALSHILWDAFTHKNGWFVQQWPLLRIPVGMVMGKQVRVFSLLWYGCSFAGVAWLYGAYIQWKREGEPAAATPKSSLSILGRSLAVATAAVLLGLVHHLLTRWQDLFVIGAVILALLIGGLVWVRHFRKRLARQ